MTITLLRCWGLDRALVVGLVVSLVAALLSDESLRLPYLRLPIPAPMLLPPLLAVLLTWPLVDRWPSHRATAARAAYVAPLSRLVGTVAICVSTGWVGSSASGMSAALTCAGTGLAALTTAVLGARAPFAMLLVGYGWLSYLTAHPVNVVTQRPWTVACVSLLIGGATYLRLASRTSWSSPSHQDD